MGRRRSRGLPAALALITLAAAATWWLSGLPGRPPAPAPGLGSLRARGGAATPASGQPVAWQSTVASEVSAESDEGGPDPGLAETGLADPASVETWPARELRGCVVAEEDGHPLSEAIVRSAPVGHDPDGGVLLAVDAQGGFRLQLPAGAPDQVVRATAPGRLPREGADLRELAGNAIRLQLPLRARVEGVVRLRPGEAHGAHRDVIVWSTSGGAAEPAADGSWGLDVRPGSHELFAAARDDDRGPATRVAHASVQVEAGGTLRGIVLELAPLVRTRVHVRARSGGLLPPRLRVQSAADLPQSLGYWELFPADELREATPPWDRSCVPEVTATLHLPAGAHRVLVLQDGRPRPVGSADVQVLGGERSDVEILVDDPASISGVVRGQVPDGVVTLVQNGHELCTARVGPGGEFRLHAWLTPGPAYVLCREGLLRFQAAEGSRPDGLCLEARGRPRVRGRLLLPAGEPLREGRLAFRSGLLPDRRSYVDLEEDGTFDGECGPGPVSPELEEETSDWIRETRGQVMCLPERTVEALPGETLDLGVVRLVPRDGG